MGKSVVGILDNETEAREVVRELSAGGFSDTDIEIVTGFDRANGEMTGDNAAVVHEQEEPSQLGKTIADFFRSLHAPTESAESSSSQLPSYADDESYYSEALERGHVVVIIRARDQEAADAACKVLNAHGGDNISTDTTDPEPTAARGAKTISASATISQPAGARAESSEAHMTPSDRTEGRVRDRGVRIYDYTEAAEAPADLREPQPDATPDQRSRTAKP
jgi:hypothetical protein